MKLLICIAMLLFSCVTSSQNKVAVTPSADIPLAWDVYQENKPWSVELRKQIGLNISALSKAKDWPSYCPKWSTLSDQNKINVISTVAVWIAYYECGWDATEIDNNDVGGTASIGLYQLSYEDHMKWCPMDAAKKNLTNPIVNIDCAVGEMAHLISQDGVVASGGRAQFRTKTAKGLARYFSTCWSDSKLLNIKAKTQALTFCK